MATTTTGLAWTVENPLKPWALFDADAIRDIPVDWTDWLADIGSIYSSHTVICETGLASPVSSESGGIVTVRIQADPLETLVAGTKYRFTCRIVAADGQQDDRSFFLKITER